MVIPAGVPRKPGMSRSDLFKINAGIVRDLSIAVAKYAPKAFVCVISNPVNSTVPVVSEVFKRYEVYDPRKIFGVTTLDLVRSSKFLAELLEQNPKDIDVQVVGGHSGHTIVPLLSQVKGSEKLTEQQIDDLANRIQFAGDEVVKAKDGAGSATLAMAYAGARFTLHLIESIFNGVPHTECAYVNLAVDTEGATSFKRIVGEVEYLAVPIEFGKGGIQKILPIGKISHFELKLLGSASQEVNESADKGATFITDDITL